MPGCGKTLFHRIAVDSLSAFERVSTPKSFREFVIGLTAFIKVQRVTAIFTNTTSLLMGTQSVTEKIEDTSQFGKIKKDIARLQTERQARLNAAAADA